MTREEAQTLMASIWAAYPAFYRDMDKKTLSLALDLWAVGLADISYGDAAEGLGLLVQRLRFPPTVAEVREAVAEAHPRGGAQARRCPVFRPARDALPPGSPQGMCKIEEVLPPETARP